MAKPIDLISTAEFARLVGLSARRIQQLIAAGALPSDTHGKISLSKGIRAYAASVRDQAKRSIPQSAANRVAEARARRIEQQMAVEERNLIPIDDATAALDEILGVALAELDGLPARVTTDLATRSAIETVIDEIRNGMADRFDQRVAELKVGA